MKNEGSHIYAHRHTRATAHTHKLHASTTAHNCTACNKVTHTHKKAPLCFNLTSNNHNAPCMRHQA